MASGEEYYDGDAMLPTHTLRMIQEVQTYTGVDNIEIEEGSGALWVASHPSFVGFLKASADPQFHGPNSVLRATYTQGAAAPIGRWNIVYQDQSPTLMGASSTGSVLLPPKAGGKGGADLSKAKVLVSPVFDKGFLVCSIDLTKFKW